MKLAYLIMAHVNPQLVRRMIRTLSFGDDDCGFFLHVDRKSPFEPWATIAGGNVTLCNRIPVYWGEFSQVQAILELVREALESANRYDYFVLITGSCYPLRTGGYIKEMFEASPGVEYMDIVAVPGPGKPLSRVNIRRYPSTMPLRRFIFRALARAGLSTRDHRKHLDGLRPYSGSGSWALTREACEFVTDFIAANARAVKFFRDTFAPDEALIHTILGNSRFRSRMRRELVFTDWSGAANGHPATIREEHVALFESQFKVSRDDQFGSGELVFARKFSDERMDLVKRVDAMIERKENVRLFDGSEVDPVSGGVPDRTRAMARS